jgi:aspartate aminotransferase-like enzyme
MYIKKQRLLTPGPTPLYPPALHAMMASDIHHRTEDFRNAYRSCLADLKEVLGTTNDVLMFAASGTGAMDASVSNLFSKGDKIIACVAGKFGERWAEIGKAYGLEVIALTVPYGQVVSPAQVEEALAKEPAVKGVFLQASETSTGAMHDVQAIAAAVAKTPAILVLDAITGIGTQPLDIHGWGLDVVIGGSQKAFMIPPGLAFLAIGPKAWALADTATLPHYYFNLKKEKKSADGGESSWTPSTALILAMAESLRFIKKTGMANMVANAQLLAQATRAASVSLGLELFAASPGSSVTAIKPPAGMDSGVIVKEFRSRFGAIIANGQGSMKGKIFRIAHLGYFDFADLFAVVAALEIILKANGYPVTYGTGVRAVQEVYERAAVLPKPATA